jgi:hypothetical protein
MTRSTTVLLLLAVAVAHSTAGAPNDAPINESLPEVTRLNCGSGGCACAMYAAPDCLEARDEFTCLAACIQRGYVFPECDSVLGCCVYIETVNAGVTCVESGGYVDFSCTQAALRHRAPDARQPSPAFPTPAWRQSKHHYA